MLPDTATVICGPNTSTASHNVILFVGCYLLQARPSRDVVPGQGSLHQPLHPQAKPVQFVVDLEGGGGSGPRDGLAGGLLLSWPGPAPPCSSSGRLLSGLAVQVLTRIDGFEEAEVLFVAIEGQDISGIVHLVAGIILVIIGVHGVLGKFQKCVHPFAVLVHIQEGEVECQAPVSTQSIRITGHIIPQVKTGSIICMLALRRNGHQCQHALRYLNIINIFY